MQKAKTQLACLGLIEGTGKWFRPRVRRRLESRTKIGGPAL